MFKKVLCCLIAAAVSSVVAWSENIQTVIKYYNPDMTNGFIYISKQDMMLTLVNPQGETVVAYPMACGRVKGPKRMKGDNRTPEGHFLLQNKHDASAWGHDFHDGKGFIKNAYGPWFLRLQTGFQGIGIHGTHAPESIGTRASEGCIRLDNDNLAELETLVSMGMPVIIGPENGVDSLILANVPSPMRIDAKSRVTRPARLTAADPVVLQTVPKFVEGQIDINPEMDLAEPLKAKRPDPLKTVREAQAETPVETPVETTVEAPAESQSEPIQEASAETQSETSAEIAQETTADTQPKTSGPRYEVVVEEVTGDDGEIKFEVRYVLLP